MFICVWVMIFFIGRKGGYVCICINNIDENNILFVFWRLFNKLFYLERKVLVLVRLLSFLMIYRLVILSFIRLWVVRSRFFRFRKFLYRVFLIIVLFFGEEVEVSFLDDIVKFGFNTLRYFLF